MAEFIFKAKTATNRAFTSTNDATTSNNVAAPTQEAFILEQADLESIKSSTRLSAFFSSADLKDLMNLSSNTGGFRIYPALDTNDNFSMLIVATDNDSNDLVFGSEPPCFVAENGQAASRKTRQEGKDMVSKVSERLAQAATDPEKTPFLVKTASSKNYSKVFFTRTAIENQLNNPNTSGIRFFSAQINFDDNQESFNTLAMVGVDETGNDVGTALLSALPCPPDCGGGSYTDDDTTL